MGDRSGGGQGFVIWSPQLDQVRLLAVGVALPLSLGALSSKVTFLSALETAEIGVAWGGRLGRSSSGRGSGTVDVHGYWSVSHGVRSVGGIPSLRGLEVLLGLRLRRALGKGNPRMRLISSAAPSEIEGLSWAKDVVDSLVRFAAIDGFLLEDVVGHGAHSRSSEDILNYGVGEALHEEALGLFVAKGISCLHCQVLEL